MASFTKGYLAKTLDRRTAADHPAVKALERIFSAVFILARIGFGFWFSWRFHLQVRVSRCSPSVCVCACVCVCSGVWSFRQVCEVSLGTLTLPPRVRRP
jgi:hypothetical protein